MLIPIALALSSTMLLSEPPGSPPPPASPPPAGAHAGAVVPAIPDTSPVVTEAIVDAPLAEVWECFTTEAGLKNLGAAQARIDFRVGGKMLTHYDPKGVLGDGGTIENTFIAYEPERMVSFRISRPPDSFPFPGAWNSTWSVATFEPIGPDRTRLRLVMLGYTADPESQKMRAFFDKGNAYVIKFLQGRLGSAEARRKSDRAWSMVRAMVGGSWRACAETADGKKVCSAARWVSGPENRSVVFTADLGESGGPLEPHVHMVIAPEPASGAVAFTAVNDQGHIAKGHVSLTAENTLTLDWTVDLAGERRFRVITFTPGGPDAYIQRVFISQDDADHARPYVELPFKRGGADAGAGDAAAGPGKPRTQGADPLAPIELDELVGASRTTVWNSLSTSAGWKEFLGVSSKITARPGGPFEIYFSDAAPEGRRGSESCTVLSCDPPSMLSYSWNAPPQFPHARESSRHTWVVMTLDAAGQETTRVRLRHLGFAEQAADAPDRVQEWRDVRAYFSNAWPNVLGALRTHFEPNAAAEARGPRGVNP